MSHIFAWILSVAQSFDELKRDIQVKHTGHTDGTEESHKDGLPQVLGLRDPAMGGEHNHWTAEKQNKDSQSDKAVDGDHVVGEELLPGTHSTVPYEDGDVKQHVHSRLKRTIKRYRLASGSDSGSHVWKEHWFSTY